LIGDCFGWSLNLVWNVSAWKHVLGIGTQVRSEDWIFLRNRNILDTLSMLYCGFTWIKFDPCYVGGSLISNIANIFNNKKINHTKIELIWPDWLNKFKDILDDWFSPSACKHEHSLYNWFTLSYVHTSLFYTLASTLWASKDIFSSSSIIFLQLVTFPLDSIMTI
jgi:hypothetical protein